MDKQAGGDQLIVDRIQPFGTFGVMRPHVVQPAITVGNERGGHRKGVESGVGMMAYNRNIPRIIASLLPNRHLVCHFPCTSRYSMTSSPTSTA
jgi:hypothetical protein